MPTRPESGTARTQPRPDPVPNWCTLSRADTIEIHQHGRTIATGRVDMLAFDGSMLWIHKDGGKGRALFLHNDGVTVYRRAPQPTRRAS